MKFLCCSCGGPPKEGEGAKITIGNTPPDQLEVEGVDATLALTPSAADGNADAAGVVVPSAEERMEAVAAAIPIPPEPDVGGDVGAGSAGEDGGGVLSPPTSSVGGENGETETAIVRAARDIGIGPPKLPASANAEPQIAGENGLYLTFNKDLGGGTLYTKLSDKMQPRSVLIARVEEEPDRGKIMDPATELAKNVKADWLQQAKATCTFVRSAANMGAELEILPAFFEDLPRKSMLVIHTVDQKILTLRSPCAFDFRTNDVDAVAVLPLGSDVYRGFSQLKPHIFLEKGVRKGATLRIK